MTDPKSLYDLLGEKHPETHFPDCQQNDEVEG